MRLSSAHWRNVLFAKGCLGRFWGRSPRWLGRWGLCTAVGTRSDLQMARLKRTRARCGTGERTGAALQWGGTHWCCAFVALPGTLTSAHVAELRGLQRFTLTRRTRVTPVFHDTTLAGQLSQFCCSPRPGTAVVAQSDSRTCCRSSHSSCPQPASRLVLSGRKPSPTSTNQPSLSLGPRQYPRHVSVATVPSSLSSSAVLDSSICSVPMNTQFFLGSAHLNVPSCMDLPLGVQERSRRATGSETKCCAPAERCDTAQDGLGDNGSQIELNYKTCTPDSPS